MRNQFSTDTTGYYKDYVFFCNLFSGDIDYIVGVKVSPSNLTNKFQMTQSDKDWYKYTNQREYQCNINISRRC